MRKTQLQALATSVAIATLLILTAPPASAHFIRQNSPNNNFFGEIDSAHTKITICHVYKYGYEGRTQVTQRDGTTRTVYAGPYTGVCWSRYVTSEPQLFRVCERPSSSYSWNCTAWRGV